MRKILFVFLFICVSVCVCVCQVRLKPLRIDIEKNASDTLDDGGTVIVLHYPSKIRLKFRFQVQNRTSEEYTLFGRDYADWSIIFQWRGIMHRTDTVDVIRSNYPLRGIDLSPSDTFDVTLGVFSKLFQQMTPEELWCVIPTMQVCYDPSPQKRDQTILRSPRGLWPQVNVKLD